ncbi:MAG TPA: cyclic nucleotide-binding domain-containing protein [Spirochaetota bacterium]|nr:cyclic nucleotide-binding domain-containing protein [Spirochaetota bacterium]HOL56780.1 cyclic nucleotide-binding domain-containing protein [Spirochaetota bacterium]HPP04247.1 cyclic nucleotide-binding domain-containing protein [Spirochaetota bacterium]
MAEGFTSEKKNYPKGSVIIIQGSSQKEINLLNEGLIEVKRYSDNIAGLSEKEILNKSKRIAVINPPAIFGIENLINNQDHKNSFVALEDCIVTKYIIPSNDFIKFFKVNIPIAMNILLTMKDMAIKGILNLKKYVKLMAEIEKFSDNFEIIYDFIIQNKNNSKYQRFLTNGGVIPPKFEPSFLTDDYSTILGVTYGDPKYDPAAKFGIKKLEFYHNLLKSKPDAFISLINANIEIFSYIYHELSNVINEINKEIEYFSTKLEEKLNIFFNKEDSPFNNLVKIADKIKMNEDLGENIARTIVTICRNIDNNYKQLSGKEHIEVFQKYDKLSKSISNNTIQTPVQNVNREEKYKKMFKDSTKIILNFSTLSDEKKEAILKNINDMKNINMEDPTDKTSRQIIRKLHEDFFELYLNIFLKIMEHHTDIPDPVKMFLYYGFIDEKKVQDEQIEFLYNSLSLLMRPQNLNYPIISLFDYLKLIYEGKESPSLTETGEIFQKLIKKVFSKNEKVIEDTPIGRTEFEIMNMVKSALRITSDNPRAYIPYLIEQSFKGSLSKIFNSPKKLETFIYKINSLDYTLFFRELTWKITGKSELIMKEIKPYFILVPNSGVRVQMWQDLVNNIRSSKGRFIVPIIFNGDLNRSLITACAHFRWELNKTIAGGNWMDPVEGGLVGNYYDYMQYYEKYKDLSLEVKEIIKSIFARIKMDRDRFAYDYFEWIEYESKGVPKLNRVVRQMFYRYIPFPKEIRENLAKLPLFTELDNKFNNIRNREYRSLEAKYHKYMENGVLPEDLQAYLDMMKR